MAQFEAPRRAVGLKYTLKVIPNDEFEATFSEEQATDHEAVSLTVTITYGETEIITSLVAQSVKGTNTILISVDQAKNFSDRSIRNAVCASCPGMWDVIQRADRSGVTLPFTEQSHEAVFVPLTKEVAASVILAFFNQTSDPLDKIRGVLSASKEGTKAKMGRLLTTYYLCCIKYLTNVDMVSAVGGDTRCKMLLDDMQLVSPKYRPAYMALKSMRRDIPKEMVAFHAVYGAYVMCRPVATKRSFREWVTKRYASFLASIQYTPETGTSLPIQEGGTHVNETVVERSIIRKVVYSITKLQSDDIVVSAIKTHVRFLTSLSEMTTYSLINQVINKGGAVICLVPLAEQVSKYATEREDVRRTMETDSIPTEDIVYLHLVKPNYQCFRSSEYPDLVKTAQIIDKMENPNETTLENYRAKPDASVTSRHAIL